ncbi:hypothetical protein HK098_000569 [Nowakowskiella sp. JEL0407]|nr:hypothetical protein HK098_000569 [Nowakowskiella sp. JEL0407]
MGNSVGKENGSEVELRHFTLLRCVGKGAFGKVRIVEKKDIKKLFALKYINKLQCIRMQAIQNIFRERAILEEINHPFLVNLRYAFQDDENMFMVLDLMIGGDIRYHLEKMHGFQENAVKFFAAELALALDYLHSKGIVHRDIKPDNLLLDEYGHIHITDFNIAVHFTPDRMLKSQSGTLAYMAPEVFDHQGYLWEVDWWGLGVVLYECLFGKRPFRGGSPEALTFSVLRGEIAIPTANLVTKQPVYVSADGISAICGFLTRNKTQRLGCGPGRIEDLKSHPWFAGWDWDLTEKKMMSPIFVPSSEKANFDATYDLEELLLEDNPLSYKSKKKKKDKEKDREKEVVLQRANSLPHSQNPYAGNLGALPPAGYVQMDGNQLIPKPPPNLTPKDRLQWELNFIEDNFKSFDSTAVGDLNLGTEIVDPPEWVRNLDEELERNAHNFYMSPSRSEPNVNTLSPSFSKARYGNHQTGRSVGSRSRSRGRSFGRSDSEPDAYYYEPPSPELELGYETVKSQIQIARSKSLGQREMNDETKLPTIHRSKTVHIPEVVRVDGGNETFLPAARKHSLPNVSTSHSSPLPPPVKLTAAEAPLVPEPKETELETPALTPGLTISAFKFPPLPPTPPTDSPISKQDKELIATKKSFEQKSTTPVLEKDPNIRSTTPPSVAVNANNQQSPQSSNFTNTGNQHSPRHFEVSKQNGYNPVAHVAQAQIQTRPNVTTPAFLASGPPTPPLPSAPTTPPANIQLSIPPPIGMVIFSPPQPSTPPPVPQKNSIPYQSNMRQVPQQQPQHTHRKPSNESTSQLPLSTRNNPSQTSLHSPVSYVRPPIQQRQQSLDPHLQLHLQHQAQQLQSLASKNQQPQLSYFQNANSSQVSLAERPNGVMRNNGFPAPPSTMPTINQANLGKKSAMMANQIHSALGQIL